MLTDYIYGIFDLLEKNLYSFKFLRINNFNIVKLDSMFIILILYLNRNMAGVAKWLRQWVVVPPFVGSSPITRPV